MAITDAPGEVVAADASKAPPARSTWGLIQLALFWIATNFLWAAVPLIILPSQVQAYLFLHRPADVVTVNQITAYLGAASPGPLAAVAGPGLIVALIANPLFGYLSDRTRLRWGRHRHHRFLMQKGAVQFYSGGYAWPPTQTHARPVCTK